jgi:rod shape-determining protein MreC
MAYRGGPFGELKLPIAWVGGGATLVALVLAVALLCGGRSDAVAAETYAPARNAVATVLKPVEGVVAAPIRWVGDLVDYVEGYFFAVSENRRLRREVAELEGWRDTAIALKNVNDRYEALLKLKTEPPIPMVAAHTIMDSRGPFSDARLLDVGARAGVQVGDPAVSEHGVVGRVVGVTNGASRLLMLTDVDSRTPVLVDRSNGRAILTGDGGTYPRLDYVRGRDALKVGDAILTSGDGGVFPRGLPVGVAVKDLKGGWRVKLYSDATPIDLVRVLLFQAFDRGPDAQALSDAESAPPPLSPAEAADRNAVLQRAATPAPPAKSGAATAAAPAPAPPTPATNTSR